MLGALRGPNGVRPTLLRFGSISSVLLDDLVANLSQLASGLQLATGVVVAAADACGTEA
jgi:hypothetical protein